MRAMGATHLYVELGCDSRRKINSNQAPTPTSQATARACTQMSTTSASTSSTYTSAAARLKAFCICICIHVHQRETTRRNTYTCGSERANEPTNPFSSLSLSSILFCLSIFSLPSFWFSHSFACPLSVYSLFAAFTHYKAPARLHKTGLCVCERARSPHPLPGALFLPS